MNYNLKIVTWNANGLLQKVKELEVFLSDERVDICLISETHCTMQSFLKVRGYSVYHTPHPSNKARGGSAVIIRESIEHYELMKTQYESMQVTTVSVSTRNRVYRISSIYCPPRHTLRKSDFTDLFKSFGSHFIIGGDFNAKHPFWGSRIISPRGKELFEAGRRENCDFHSSGEPTYWPTDNMKTPDLIDFFITKGLSDNYVKVENSHDLCSDHSPVVMTVSKTLVEKLLPPRLTSYKTDWEGFQKDLEDRIETQVPLKTPEQLLEEVELYNRNVQQAAWNNTPVVSRTTAKSMNIPLEVRQLVREKRKARKKWQISRYPQDKMVLNRLSNKLKEVIDESKNEAVSTYLQGLTPGKDTDYSLWKVTKGLKRPVMQVPPIRKENHKWARSNQEKAEIFAEYLEKTFKPHPGQTCDESVSVNYSSGNMIIKQVTLKELKDEIKLLNIKKAPGYDLITGQVLKALPGKAIVKLLHLINASFRLKFCPSQWKVAEVIMVPKPGKDLSDRKSYRPISLLPIISKLFEKLLLRRLKPVIEENQLIPTHQFGFRNQHSTIDQVHRVTGIIEESLENKRICSAVFLDISQAFDKVWHEGLLFKLQRDLPDQFYQILKSYLMDRMFRVKQGNEYSEIKTISAGVPQGSVLGPILYLLYTRDIPVNENTTMATFADDTAVLAVGATVEEASMKLQRSINNISTWMKKWRLKLNESKSTHINFTNNKLINVPIHINSQVVPSKLHAKYLGMTLDARLNWKPHVKMKRTELNLKFRSMYWLLGRKSGLEISNKLLLYKQVLKPVWMYGLQLWGCTKKTNVKVIQSFQNRVLRSIVDAPWYVRNDDLHRDLKMDMVINAIKGAAWKHEHRLQNHVNSDVLKMLQSRDTVRRLKRTKPLDLVQ